MPPGSSEPFVDLQRLHMQLTMEYDNLLVVLERREDKIERQAVQITRLEASRKTLRENNNQMRTQIAGYQIDR